jgi:hypothetical protein
MVNGHNHIGSTSGRYGALEINNCRSLVMQKNPEAMVIHKWWFFCAFSWMKRPDSRRWNEL